MLTEWMMDEFVTGQGQERENLVDRKMMVGAGKEKGLRGREEGGKGGINQSQRARIKFAVR